MIQNGNVHNMTIKQGIWGSTLRKPKCVSLVAGAGSVLSNVLLVLGMSFLFGGLVPLLQPCCGQDNIDSNH
jgi:predicted phage tail protein